MNITEVVQIAEKKQSGGRYNPRHAKYCRPNTRFAGEISHLAIWALLYSAERAGSEKSCKMLMSCSRRGLWRTLDGSYRKINLTEVHHIGIFFN